MVDSVIIEPVTKHDDEGFHRLVQTERARLSAFFPLTTERCTDVRSTRKYLKEIVDRSNKREFYCFVLREFEGGDPIGAVFLKQFDWTIPKCETAYFVAASYEKHGLGSMGVIWATDFALSQLGVNKVIARIAPDNIASVRVAEKCGFQLEGLIRRDFRAGNGELMDVLQYGLVR
ncbi:MAG: GNAT family N-acetyltransferase [Flavobacteriales bacterium]|nr:GNAT family N-acetyltransferase [Flavobacteriales bacterium]MBK9193501.1 GNAT family N-acetyltransferase [Flavobacteriales bacterium]